MKEAGTAHWVSPNSGATNESGFTALPGGYRYYSDGTFYYVGYDAIFWTAMEYDASSAWGCDLHWDSSELGRFDYYRDVGFSVRCIVD